MLILLFKDISFESENFIVYNFCLVVTNFLEFFIPFICIKKFFVRTKWVKKLMNFSTKLNIQKSFSNFNDKMMIEFKEYKSNLGKSSLVSDNNLEFKLPKKFLFSSEVQEGLL